MMLRHVLLFGIFLMTSNCQPATHPQTYAAPPPPPTLARLSRWASGGEFDIPETLTGTNFVMGATAVQVKGTTGMTVVSEVVSSTSIRATFGIARDVKPGTYLVTVTTEGGTSAQPFIVQSTSTRDATSAKPPKAAKPGSTGKPSKGATLKAFFQWFS